MQTQTLRSPSWFALFLVGLVSPIIKAATVEGYVRDAAGAAVAGAVIRVQLKSNGTAANVQTVRAEATGAYRVSLLHNGTYTLRATGNVPGEVVVGPFILAESESKKVDLVFKNTAASAEFFDEPRFTVAGVTEHAYVGGHGSDSVMRSAEALSQATNALSKLPADAPPTQNTTEKQLRVTLERERGNLERASQADPGNPSLHHLIANDYELLNQPLKAVREYQRAAELDPSETNLFDWGTELLIHRALEPAAQVYARGTRLFPLSSQMLLGSAVALYAHGDYIEAARQFFAATDLNPADPGPYLFLAKTERPEITNSAGFRERLARFARLDPQNAWANYYYAMSLWNDPEMLATVQSLLEKAVHLNPKLSVAYLQLGVLYAEKHDYQAAISAYQKAIEADPRLEQAHYRLAEAYRQTGDAQNAQKEIAAFQQLSKTLAGELERQRSELQQFVVSLKRQSSN